MSVSGVVTPPPAVSVLMPVYNTERYVGEAVRAVLQQTFRDFEFIIIDDGSADGSTAILRRFSEEDGRIRLVSRPNTGYVTALNEALGLARAPLVARMDADDVALPNWLEVLVAFMQAHPEVVTAGVQVNHIDPDGEFLGRSDMPLAHEAIETEHLKGELRIFHPGVCFRTEAARHVGGYRPEVCPCEDYDLWLRLGEVGRLQNVPEVLLAKRSVLSSVVATTSLSRAHVIETNIRRVLGEAWSRRGRGGEPPPVRVSCEDTAMRLRQWAWWALGAGNVRTARKHAWNAFREAPGSVESWRV